MLMVCFSSRPVPSRPVPTCMCISRHTAVRTNHSNLTNLGTKPTQANYKLWPLANAINFSLVPLKLRVLFANVVSVFWNMYLSAASNR